MLHLHQNYLGNPISDDDLWRGPVNLTKKEESNAAQVIIYILFAILGVTVIAIIILFCYMKMKNKKIKKLGGRI